MKRRLATAAVCSAAALFAASLEGAVEKRPVSSAPGADLEIVSVGADHAELAPATTFTLTFVVRSRSSSVGPFSVGVYYARGAAVSGALPKDARMLFGYPVERGLAKGAAASFSTSVRVPSCAEDCGPHAIYVVADPSNQTADSLETNNVRAVTLDVAQDHLPDLRVEKVAISPDRGSTSDTVAVRATVRNASRYFAHGPFRVSVYCSPDAEVTASDHRLYSFMVPALGASQTVGIDRAVALQPSCGVRALSTWVGVLADDEDAVKEANEQNDGKSAPFWVFRSPDLTTQKVFLSETSGPSGSRLLVSYKVSNVGGSSAGAFRSAVYLSKNPTAPLSGALLDTVNLPSLAANVDSGAIEQAVTIPALPRGAYYVGVVVDPDNANGELRKRNNLHATSFQITETNLTEAHFAVTPKVVAPASTLSLRLSVRNTGLDAAVSSKVAFYYSDDPRFDVERDVKLGELDLGAVAGRATTKERALDVVGPRDAREGYRFVLAVIDDGDQVRETDEHDNVALEAIQVGTSE